MTQAEIINIVTSNRGFKLGKKPSHEVVIQFEGAKNGVVNLESFVDSVQDQLSKSGSAYLDMFGIDVDETSGEFLFKCQEGLNPKDVFNELLPTMFGHRFFDYSDVVFYKLNDDGKYHSVRERISGNMLDLVNDEDEDPEPPTPEGFEKKTGCFSGAGILLGIVVIVMTLIVR